MSNFTQEERRELLLDFLELVNKKENIVPDIGEYNRALLAERNKQFNVLTKMMELK